MKKIKSNNKGFSLIELIIVIAIMAVLVAIIAPNLTKYLASSKKKTDAKNLDEIESTLKTCITDYETNNGDLLAASGSMTLVWKPTTGTTAVLSASVGGNATFTALVKAAIDDSKPQSKENTSKYAKAVITKGTDGTYSIATSWN